MRLRLKNERGFVMLLALFVVSLVLTHSMVGLTRATGELLTARHSVASLRTFHAAEAALDSALADLKQQIAVSGQFPAQIMPPVLPMLPGMHVQSLTAVYATAQRTATIHTNTDPLQTNDDALEPFEGMTAILRDLEVRADVDDTQGHRTRLQSVLTFHLVPIFQFAVYDWDDWTFTPGPAMQITGNIYAQGSIALGPDTGLTIRGNVSTGEEFLHILPGTGYVRIADANGTLQDMWQGSEWLESTDGNWATESQARWDGRVTAHARSITLPLPWVDEAPIDPIELIRPGVASDSAGVRDARLYYKADLRILGGQPYDSHGSPVTLPAGTVTTNSFYDAREGEVVRVTEINVGLLRDHPPANGIVYVGEDPAHPASADAVRLVNGTELPTNGLTVVSHHPLYVKGSYNTVNQQPAALIGDALTVLSDNWDDTHGNWATHSRTAYSRTAVNTQVNAAVMSGRARQMEGDTPSQPADAYLTYGGASEHMLRFLEDWGGQTFIFMGSEVSPWDSREATTDLACCGDGGAYNPPIRIWNFDQTFLNGMSSLPPGTPRVYVAVTGVWRQMGLNEP